MSIALDLNVQDTGSATLAAVAEAGSPEFLERLHGVMAAAVAKQVREHLVGYSQDHPNKLGGKRTFFFRDAAMSTAHYATSAEGTVTVAKTGIRLQYYGGTVEPGRNPSSKGGKPTRFLTIPACAEAYGRRASEIPNLTVLFGRKGPYALVEESATRLLGKGKSLNKGESYVVKRGDLKAARGGRIMFWLAASATVGPHPEILPLPGDMASAAVAAGVKFMLMDAKAKGGR